VCPGGTNTGAHRPKTRAWVSCAQCPKRDITYRDMKAVRFYCEGYDEECKGQLWLPGCQTLRVTFS